MSGRSDQIGRGQLIDWLESRVAARRYIQGLAVKDGDPVLGHDCQIMIDELQGAIEALKRGIDLGEAIASNREYAGSLANGALA